MNFIPALKLCDLKKNSRMTVVVNELKILFIWIEDKVHAVESQCPHFKLPLAKGKINDNNELVCPFHHSAFDLCTGDVKCWSPWPLGVGKLLGKVSKPKKLKIYKTEVRGDEVFVEV